MPFRGLIDPFDCDRTAGEPACAEALASISGVVFDSTPDPAYDPPLLKQVAVASVA
jgi:hypothetical protein